MASKLQHCYKLIWLRGANNISRRFYSEGLPENLRRNMEKFQREDGVPVYLKGGIGDRILLGITCVLLAIGLEESARTFIKLDVKK